MSLYDCYISGRNHREGGPVGDDKATFFYKRVGPTQVEKIELLYLLPPVQCINVDWIAMRLSLADL